MVTSISNKSTSTKKSVKAIQEDKTNAPVSPTDKVVGVVKQLAATMTAAIGEIREINENAKLLSLNARIEAARAGASGAAFGVVAQEMQALSNNTATVADEMANRTQKSISDLVDIIGGNVRGARLADIALNSIDLIDRNLYERTCDCRWWATDASLVDALEDPTADRLEHASRRMGVILNAYTVYHDLVLCDVNGRIVANGRPNQFSVVGRSESKSSWFTRALATRTGNDFAFQSAHNSSLVNDQSVLIYSATVRRGGEASNPTIGVLGVIFNWASLAGAVLTNASLEPIESERTLRVIVDNEWNILASSRPLPLDYRLPKDKLEGLLSENKGYILTKIDNKDCCVAHALSPGFETYATGWHAFLIQEISS